MPRHPARPPLTEAERATRDRLFAENRYLAKWVAKRYLNRGIDVEDLDQIAAAALLKAATKFRPELGFKFTTYATRAIASTIKQAIRQDRAIPVPEYLHTLQSKLLQSRLDVDTFADQMQLTRQRRESLRRMVEGDIPVALNAAFDYETFEAEDEDVASDWVAVDRQPEPWEQAAEREQSQQARDRVAELLPALSRRELGVIRRRFGLGGEPEQTLKQVGKPMRLCAERVRQVQRKAIAKMRAAAC